MSTHYDTMGVPASATPDDVKKAFRALAMKHHPDRGGNADTFKKITEAYAVLSSPEKRREYDSRMGTGSVHGWRPAGGVRYHTEQATQTAAEDIFSAYFETYAGEWDSEFVNIVKARRREYKQSTASTQNRSMEDILRDAKRTAEKIRKNKN